MRRDNDVQKHGMIFSKFALRNKRCLLNTLKIMRTFYFTCKSDKKFSQSGIMPKAKISERAKLNLIHQVFQSK